MIAGSELPSRGAGLTDELPAITIKFEPHADAWARWQGNADLGAPTVRVGFLDWLERATHWLPNKLAERSIADRVSGWLCRRLPERILTAVACVVAWADGHEQAPRQPEPYRETYRPARYVGRAAPIVPQRHVSVPWLLASLDGVLGTPAGDELLAHRGIEGYEGSHRRDRAPGSATQRERDRARVQWDTSTSALRAIDQRDKMRTILADPLALSRMAFQFTRNVNGRPAATIVLERVGTTQTVKIASVA